MKRRTFLKATAASVGFSTNAWLSRLNAFGANDRLRVAVMGLGRGMAHVSAIQKIPQLEIAHLCDVDSLRLESARKEVEKSSGKAPPGTQDFRSILNDKSVDALFIATCNHWHAPATILACAAGKHVYVEKPGSHNAAEGEAMVKAARKHARIVQMGNQRRTWPAIREGIEKLKSGAIGRVTFARAWYNAQRPSIGRGTVMAPPPNLDFSMWQGPAPERPYQSNLLHYNWHWRWHWGGGELANNGVHALDVVRWGLGVEFPTQVSYVGGRYAFVDDQETPDTGVATFQFGDKGAAWEGSSCHPRKGEDQPFVAFYGDGGILSITDPGYKIVDAAGKVVVDKGGEAGDVSHIANFIASVRGSEKPNSEIEEAQKSTLLCHLGNISYRTGRTIRFDPSTRKIVGDPEAERLWSRDYRPGWEPLA